MHPSTLSSDPRAGDQTISNLWPLTAVRKVFVDPDKVLLCWRQLQEADALACQGVHSRLPAAGRAPLILGAGPHWQYQHVPCQAGRHSRASALVANAQAKEELSSCSAGKSVQAEGAAAFRSATEGRADVARGMLKTHSWWAAMPLEMRSESSLRLMGNLQARHTRYERNSLLVKPKAEPSWRLEAAWVPMSKA